MTSIKPIAPHTIAAALVFAASFALAQEPARASSKAAAATTPTATTTAATVATPTDTASSEPEFDSRETAREFEQLLERHPREVGVMLKLDPSLFHNEPWMAAYPALRDYVARHPEVAQNPSYYLGHVWIPGDEAPEPAGVRAVRDMMNGISVFVVMVTIITALSWLIRTMLEHRRWSRVSKAQTEIYNKLLDRFTSHEDLLRYVESTAGKDFIRSAVVPPQASAPSVAQPVSRILWSAQIGVVATAVGIGLQYVGGRLHPDVAGTASLLGVLVLCGGIGFVLSGVVAYMISKRLGIIAAPQEPETAPTSARTLTE